jgi:hypothetical protein
MRITPERLALVTDTRVPLLQVAQRQAGVFFDEGAVIVFLNEKVLVIKIFNCVRLYRTRCSTKVGGCRGGRAGTDTARGRSRHRLVKSLDVV